MTYEIKRKIGETCIVCEKVKEKGIHLYHSFICIDCEKSIIETETDDPKYQYYLKQLKKVSSQNILT